VSTLLLLYFASSIQATLERRLSDIIKPTLRRHILGTKKFEPYYYVKISML